MIYTIRLAIYSLTLMLFLPLIGYNAITAGYPIWNVVLLITGTVFIGNTLLIYQFYRDEKQ